MIDQNSIKLPFENEGLQVYTAPPVIALIWVLPSLQVVTPGSRPVNEFIWIQNSC